MACLARAKGSKLSPTTRNQARRPDPSMFHSTLAGAAMRLTLLAATMLPAAAVALRAAAFLEPRALVSDVAAFVALVCA